MVSAPVFKRIADATLRYLGVPPDIDRADPVIVAAQSVGAETPVDRPGAHDPIVSLVAAGNDGQPAAVPDLRGCSAREAVRTLVKIGMNVRARGDGFVVSQSPAPGSPFEPGAVCQLVLARTPPASGAQPPSRGVMPRESAGPPQ
jgi:beta-lactam-binding protein with PASTA domain